MTAWYSYRHIKSVIKVVLNTKAIKELRHKKSVNRNNIIL